MPFALTPIAWLVLIGAVLGGLWWVVDEIGDRRELKVRAEYVEAARRKNAEIGAFNSADDAVNAIAEAALQQHLEQAKKVAGACPFTPEQAAALTTIRKSK